MVKDLKICQEFRDLLPPLSKERFDSLEQMILTEGYDGTPILLWNGYIVDGHHRYKIFKKHNIEFNTEEISISRDSDKSDVMDWMIAYQDARRNMNDAEKIYANDKVSAQRIREENEKKKLSTLKQNSDGRCAQMDATEQISERDRSTNTREQRAKLSGVSSGTISRYDTVMKSGDNKLKQSMLSGDVKIGTAYRQVVQEKNQLRKDNIESPQLPSLSKPHKTEPKHQVDAQTKAICEFLKTERNADFNYDINQDITSLQFVFKDKVKEIQKSIFDNQELMTNMTEKHSKILIQYLNEVKDDIENIIKIMEDKYEK